MYSGFLGIMVENQEPVTWAEQVVEAARSAGHRRLATLYLMASQCYVTGRIEDSIRYSQAAERVLGGARDEVPYGRVAWTMGGTHGPRAVSKSGSTSVAPSWRATSIEKCSRGRVLSSG